MSSDGDKNSLKEKEGTQNGEMKEQQRLRQRQPPGLMYPKPGFILNPETKRVVKRDGPTGQYIVCRHAEQVEMCKRARYQAVISSQMDALPLDLQNIIREGFLVSLQKRYLQVLQGRAFDGAKAEKLYWERRAIPDDGDSASHVAIAYICKSEPYLSRAIQNMKRVADREEEKHEYGSGEYDLLIGNLKERLSFDHDRTYIKYLTPERVKRIESLFKRWEARVVPHEGFTQRQFWGLLVNLYYECNCPNRREKCQALLAQERKTS